MYKIGDKVIVVKDTCCHREEIGSILTIRDVYSHSYHYGNRYRYSGGRYPLNYVVDQDIELLFKKEPKKLLMDYLSSHKSQ